ncbi:tetratricopeptide repeat protein [Nocardiopsis sp. RSe5-2]|uniref:Tetratricopeptide repeat protein n=1 Tax=Nocardiopsis endophytica TaxID=3018445 RepID=A0ABT4UDX5_9ACTN|nr:tetratricopeptide repeat protein [Nocardiopsis endophytica]MDA2815184.1 tetratricopeptide repeat protein [Nocardiopsis endophytica]
MGLVSLWRNLMRRGRAVPPQDPAPSADPEASGRTPGLRVASLERTLDDKVQRHGSEDPRTIAARNNLANKYAQIGRREAARLEFERTLEEAVKVFGEEHPQTDVIRENLAWICADSARPAQAAELWEVLLRHRTERLGPMASDTVEARTRLADALRRSGEHEAAVAHYERAIEDAADPVERERLRVGLSMALSAAGRYEEAVRQLRLVLAQRSRRLGSRHHDTLVIHHRLGRAYTQAGMDREAIDTLREAYRNGLAAVGDPEIRMLTFKMRRDLAGAYSAAGRHREAASLF